MQPALLGSLLLSTAPLTGALTSPTPPAPQDEGDVRALSETVITATLTPRRSLDSPYSEEVIGEETLRRRGYKTVPQILRDVPGVIVQETAPGHGSPYIRGFTSFRNLFLIDGIRLNNSVFRPGPNQYWNTVDPYTIESMEVVKGPASVLWGSDAIGGLVYVQPRGPYDFDGGDGLGGRLFYRYATAEDSNQGRLEGSLRSGATGVLVGVGAKHFGDLHAGGSTGDQPETGYSELDADMVLEHRLNESMRLEFGFQHVYQNDVPRTHKTEHAVPFQGSSVGSELRRDSDQERNLVYGQLEGEADAGFFDRYYLSLSWQGQSEDRHRNRDSGPDEQGFDVGQTGLVGHLSSPTSVGRLTYGLDLYHDEVDSYSSKEPIQGPVGDDSSYDLLGVFVQDEIGVTDDLDLLLGARFQYAAADADSVKDPVSGDKIAIDEDWSALVGSARFLYRVVPDSVHLFGGASQGFRAPNLSDLTRLDSARSDEYEIPSPGLDPERTTTYELGIKTESERASSELALFYTDIEDQIVRFPTGDVDDKGTPGNTADDEFEVTKDNVGDGYVTGVEFGGALELLEELVLFGNATYQYGKVSTYPTSAQVASDEYITRMMPFMAQLGLRWEDWQRGWWVEAQLVYADDADKLNTRDQGDTQRIPPGGTPSYLIANLRGGMEVTENVTFDLGLENLGDVNYRVHGSGHNMPGFNVVLGLRMSL